MNALLVSVFVASLLGSLHCLGMCGPFALLAGTQTVARGDAAPAGRTILPPIASYHLGRLTTYLLVGVVAGWLGMAVDFGASWYGWQRAASYGAGGVMVAVGLLSLLRQFGWLRVRSWQPLGWVSWLQAGFRRVVHWPPLLRAWAIGALTTWMPCGWLYVFAMTAAGVATPWGGALVMGVFWLGSIPILFAAAWGLNWQTRRWRLPTPLLTACLVIAAGVFTMWYRAPISLAEMHRPPSRDWATLRDDVNTVDPHALPCCQSEDSP